jgi:transcriptional regulator with XRE-family HTH domain
MPAPNPADPQPESPRRRREGVRNVVGARVRQARRSRRPRLTQEDLAALLTAYDAPIDASGVSKIEAGTRSVYDYEVLALSEALVIPVAWLLGADDGDS